MCLYHYIYFSSCRHGELSQITYCDKATALGLAERDSLPQRNISTGTDQANPPNISSSSSRPKAATSERSNSLSHSHTQQYHPTMALLPPSRAGTLLGWAATSAETNEPSPHHAALVPRSVLPEAGLPGSACESLLTTSMEDVQAYHDLSNHGIGLSLSTGNYHQNSQHERAATACTSAHTTCNFDVEAIHGSSETSVEIITERHTTGHNVPKSFSPRKPLPAQWFPSTAAASLPTASRTKVHDGVQSSPTGSPVERKIIRSARSSLDINKAHTVGASFLTKEALDAVDANITSPTLRRSPSKVERSHVKIPWNSPNGSPKPESPRQNARFSVRTSPTRTAHTSPSIDHRRAPSSIVSTGATSFHTAHGSPVRSPAHSQTSFASSEDQIDDVDSQCPRNNANDNLDQAESDTSKTRLITTKASTSLRTRASRPELSLRIPPPGSASDVERRPTSVFTSATSSAGAGTSQGSTPVSPRQSSRIPRMSPSKGSSARAPTVSSTLKQTKSTQTLRSPKATKRVTESDRKPLSTFTEAKPLRHVRTVDSSGSTPILPHRRARDSSVPASITSALTTLTEQMTQPSKNYLLTSYLQDTAVDTQRVLEPAHCMDEPSPTSRSTSMSTVRAPRPHIAPASADSAIIYSLKKPDDTGNIHSSDADDEYDDSIISTPKFDKESQNASPIRGRSTQYDPRIRRVTPSEISMQSSLASDLRATATEFVPARRETTVEEDANDQPVQAPTLPNMYALDSYGIPWFYHMYPVPWPFPPPIQQGRSRSPRKFRHRKQRSSVSSPVEHQQVPHEVRSPFETEVVSDVVETAPSLQPVELDGKTISPQCQESTGTPGDAPVDMAAPYSKPTDSPFSIQLDMIARQTARQNTSNTMRPPQVDLTKIRNVPLDNALRQTHSQAYATVPSRRQHRRHEGNGLYGGRGNVGIPLYATVPFPDPVAPLGRPTEHYGRDPKAYVGYKIGAGGCGTIDIETAAEHGGGTACNTCEPDH